MKCLCCEGKGCQCVEVINVHGKHRDITEYSIPCVWCNGTGNMDQRQKCNYEGYKDIWCQCGKHTDVTFVDDNQDSNLRKHHWICNRCGKIVQIG